MPKSKPKPSFTDGIDPNFLLSDEERAKPKEELDEIARQKDFAA